MEWLGGFLKSYWSGVYFAGETGIQYNSPNMYSIFLGAGFSKWAANLPTAGELFDFSVEPFGNREKKRLEIVMSLKGDWDNNNPRGLAEQFIAYALSLSKRDRDAVLWYIVRRLSEPFIYEEYLSGRLRRHTLMIDEKARFKANGALEARDFLQGFCGLSTVGIITSNYDMLIEYTLGTKGFNYGIANQTLIGRGPYPLSAWNNPVKLTGKIKLAKLHGSISWDENASYSDGRRGLTGRALIIPPTPTKAVDESLKIKFMWELASHILHVSTELLVFGFSFNPYDTKILEFLKANGNHIRSVLIVDIVSKLNIARELWPNAAIFCCQPPPKGDEIIYNWKKTL